MKAARAIHIMQGIGLAALGAWLAAAAVFGIAFLLTQDGVIPVSPIILASLGFIAFTGVCLILYGARYIFKGPPDS